MFTSKSIYRSFPYEETYFSVFAILMVFMLAGCGLKGQLFPFSSSHWIYTGEYLGMNVEIELSFHGDVCNGYMYVYYDFGGYSGSKDFSLSQEPYIVDGDQLTLNLTYRSNGEDIPLFVGTYTAEVKNKKLTLTDKDGELNCTQIIGHFN